MVNLLENLPDEIIYRIYKIDHEIKFKTVLCDICNHKPWWLCMDARYMLLHALYNSDMSKKDLEDYFKNWDFLTSLMLRVKYSLD